VAFATFFLGEKIKMKINENDAKLIAFIINDWVERVTDDEDHINVVDRFNNDAKRREMIHGTVWDQSFLYDSNDKIRKGNYYDALYQQLDGLLTIIKADKLRAKLYEANLIDDSSDYYKSCIENINECYQDNLEEINECLDHVEKHEKQIIEKWEEKKSNEKLKGGK
jgi:hypothetical protein